MHSVYRVPALDQTGRAVDVVARARKVLTAAVRAKGGTWFDDLLLEGLWETVACQIPEHYPFSSIASVIEMLEAAAKLGPPGTDFWGTDLLSECTPGTVAAFNRFCWANRHSVNGIEPKTMELDFSTPGVFLRRTTVQVDKISTRRSGPSAASITQNGNPSWAFHFFDVLLGPTLFEPAIINIDFDDRLTRHVWRVVVKVPVDRKGCVIPGHVDAANIAVQAWQPHGSSGVGDVGGDGTWGDVKQPQAMPGWYVYGMVIEARAIPHHCGEPFSL
jgi:hypothetical protein